MSIVWLVSAPVSRQLGKNGGHITLSIEVHCDMSSYELLGAGLTLPNPYPSGVIWLTEVTTKNLADSRLTQDKED